MKATISLFFSIIVFLLGSCNQTSEENNSKNIVQEKTEEPKFVPNEKFLAKHSDTCGCATQFELKDSAKLVHVKGLFYKSATGHLYERTVGQQEIKGHLTDHEYFNGHFSQDVDPLTFERLDGWYAKDKNYAYYYRPVSGGMLIVKIDTADVKTFRILQGHYKYAMDKNFFYSESQIIDGFIPGKSKLKLDNKGRLVAMTCNKKTYKFEIVE